MKLLLITAVREFEKDIKQLRVKAQVTKMQKDLKTIQKMLWKPIGLSPISKK